MTANEDHPTAPSEDAKAKFREALERKKADQHRSEDSAAHGGANEVRGSETVGPVQRTFRRKSG